MTILQRSKLRNKYWQCRQFTNIKSLNQYVMTQGRVVSTTRPMDVSVHHNWMLQRTRKLQRSQLMTCVRSGDGNRLSTSSAFMFPTHIIVDLIQYDWGALWWFAKDIHSKQTTLRTKRKNVQKDRNPGRPRALVFCTGTSRNPPKGACYSDRARQIKEKLYANGTSWCPGVPKIGPHTKWAMGFIRELFMKMSISP